MQVRTVADLGGLVRERRAEARLTQAALAERAGVGVKFLIRLEQGHPGLEIGRVLSVLEALGLVLKVVPGEKDGPGAKSQALLDAIFESLERGGDHR